MKVSRIKFGFHVYYIEKQDKLWISPLNVGDFTQEDFNLNYYYLGEL